MPIKRVLFINRGDSGSSGTIVSHLFDEAAKYGYEAFFVGFSIKNKGTNKIAINSGFFNTQANRFLTKISGGDGFHNKQNTKRIIKIIDEIKPNIVNIHNVLGYFLNFPLLINYLNEKNIKIVITCHDCWFFTGKCTHFEYIGCYKWKKECCKCPQLKEYPKSFFFDKTNKFFHTKKELFTNKHIYFISPSSWLKRYIDDSFLCHEKTLVINNGIDTTIYKSQNRTNHDKKINLFFAANPWTNKKGIETLLYLANHLSKERYNLLVAGKLPREVRKNKIINALGVLNQSEMIKTFQRIDIFVNPTLEDNYPTIDIEALLSGVFVISYDTGGTKEILKDNSILVEKNNKEAMLTAIENCSFIINKSIPLRERYSYERMAKEYYSIFEDIANE